MLGCCWLLLFVHVLKATDLTNSTVTLRWAKLLWSVYWAIPKQEYSAYRQLWEIVLKGQAMNSWQVVALLKLKPEDIKSKVPTKGPTKFCVCNKNILIKMWIIHHTVHQLFLSEAAQFKAPIMDTKASGLDIRSGIEGSDGASCILDHVVCQPFAHCLSIKENSMHWKTIQTKLCPATT